MKCYALKDKKMNNFQSFVWAPHIAEVTRSLTTLVQDPKSNYHRFADDFALYFICEGNLDTGHVTVSVDGPRLEFELMSLKGG